MSFKLRKHQKEMLDICKDILTGEKPESIIASVKPGGGKSALPVILADSLIPAVADRILWIVPRNALKWQGEEEFTDARWKTPHRIRAAINDSDPCRGLQGYITTYQAIGTNPELHLKEVKKHKYIVFLDEPHHVSVGSEWEAALAPIMENAWLKIFASGTFSRGDGKKIAFLDYNGMYIDLTETKTTRIIEYSREQGLKDNAILPYKFRMLDGKATWEEKGITKSSQISTRNEKLSSRALFTALRTEYAYQLLDAAILQWQEDCRNWLTNMQESCVNMNTELDQPKLLVVSPDIEHAQFYLQHIKSMHRLRAKIATSEETIQARRNIEDFKTGDLHILVTVAMAYEGLSVKPVTVIAALTGIRSIPWLEQMFARGNRIWGSWKKFCTIFLPNDMRIKEAIRTIEQEQLLSIHDQNERGEKNLEDPEETPSGDSEPWINPLKSSADDHELYVPELSYVTPSTQEEILKKEIRNIKELELSGKNQGALLIARKLFYKRIRMICDKSLEEMTLPELTKVWMKLRELYI